MTSEATSHLTLADGRRLRLRTWGTGAPRVVLEAGMGCSSSGWLAVAPLIAANVPVVAYDRAGYGQSDPGPAPRSLAALASDLIEVLDQLDGDRYVLVGHSWGGPIVRQVAAQRPDLVAGLVLADPSDEGMELFWTDKAAKQRQTMAKLAPWSRRLGLLHLAARAASRPLPPDAASELRRTDTTAPHAAALAAELATFEVDLGRWREHPPSVQDVPFVVVTGTKRTKKVVPGTGDEARDAVFAANEARVATYPRGRHVEATESTHYVPFSEPALLAREVLAVLADADAVSTDPSTTDLTEEP